MFKTHRDRAETITFRLDKITEEGDYDYPLCAFNIATCFLTVFNIRSYVIYLVRFQLANTLLKLVLESYLSLKCFQIFTDKPSLILHCFIKKNALVKILSGLSTEMIRFIFQRKSFNYAIICYPFLIKQSILNTFKIYHFDI